MSLLQQLQLKVVILVLNQVLQKDSFLSRQGGREHVGIG